MQLPKFPALQEILRLSPVQPFHSHLRLARKRHQVQARLQPDLHEISIHANDDVTEEVPGEEEAEKEGEIPDGDDRRSGYHRQQ